MNAPNRPIAPIAIGLENASVHYGDHAVLDKITLTIEKPEVTVILGPNGAGKSTLLSAMAGLIPLNEGRQYRIEADGRPAAMTRLGYVLQKPVIFRRTVMDNLKMALRAAGLPTAIDPSHPLLAAMGIDALFHKPAHQLSHGERQRLAVARVLLMQPGLLLFDEATNSLDQASIAILEDQTRAAAASGLPVLWVTHSMDQARRLADRVIVMEKGVITLDMPAAQAFSES